MIVLQPILASAAEGIRSFDVAIRALVYDPYTARIYATSPDGLLQIDPETGAVLRTFELGSNFSRLELGADRGLWMGVDGDGAVRRFNLQTLTAEDPIVVRSNARVGDLSPSRFDPYYLAVSVVPNGSTTPEARLLRNGAVLPLSQPITHLALEINSVLGQEGTGNINRYPVDGFGIAPPVAAIASGRLVSSMELAADALYSSAGIVWPAPFIALDRGSLAHSTWGGTVTINRETGEILYLSAILGHMELNRYDSSRRQTGSYIIPDLASFDPTDLTIAAWSSNRLAFHSASNLFLVDLDTVFAPTDVGLLGQTLSVTNVEFGQPITLTLTVTNHGPGNAFNVTITNSLPPGTIFDPADQPVARELGLLRAGETADFGITLIPSSPGIFSNGGAVSASNDRNAANDSREFSFPVLLPNQQLFSIRQPVADMAYNADSGRLFFYSSARVWGLEPSNPKLLPFVSVPGVVQVEMDAAFSSLLFGYLPTGTHQPANLLRLDPATLEVTAFGGSYFGTVRDLKMSPRDTNLVVTSDSTGTYLLWNDQLTQVDTRQGTLGFSEDGSTLYRADDTCAVDSFRITNGQASFLNRTTNVACGDFVAVGDLLLFDSGTIFNPTTGEKRSSGITPPAFVTRSPSGNVNVLRRMQGQWAISRLDRGTLQPVSTNLFPELPTGILDAVSAGENHLALRTVEELYILETTDSFGALRLTRQSSGELSLSFGTVADRRYQVEHSPNLAPLGWAPFGAEIMGDGFTARTVIALGRAAHGFYRVAERAGSPQ